MHAFVFLRPARLLIFPIAAALAAGAGCGSSVDDGAAPDPGPVLRDSGLGGVINLDGSKADALPPGGKRVNPLCGSVSTCDPGKIPDDPMGCADFVEDPGVRPRADAGRHEDRFDASASGGDAAPPDAAVAPTPDASYTPDAGAPLADAAADAPRDAKYVPPSTVPENPTEPSGERYACQVRSDSNGNPTHGCARSGTGITGSPCSSTNDCRAGLSCVGQEGAGECRPYCCALDSNPCADSDGGGEARTFCSQRLLLEPGRPPTLRVPVCVPAEVCELGKPYPCTGTECRCPADTACTVVAADGTTGCVKPGTGRVGDSCGGETAEGCAAGYFCSPTLGQCLKICDTADTDACAPGKCQATVGFPEGFGVCVGLSPTVQ